ncbi:MAG TPA: helix-turn-helix domain-containing protein [Pyrinomonadaceae bacterium]|nr:helix-turn-helix domain-containing protein [Pyrinomonadaceae bacterium]
MNGFVTNSSTLPRDVPNRTAKFLPNRLVSGLNRSQFFDSRISYLKILALSLLREIASAETMQEGNDTIDLQAEVRRFETELIRSALIHTGGRQRQAARLLKTKVTTLNTKIKRYKIEIPELNNIP